MVERSETVQSVCKFCSNQVAKCFTGVEKDKKKNKKVKILLTKCLKYRVQVLIDMEKKDRKIKTVKSL